MSKLLSLLMTFTVVAGLSSPLMAKGAEATVANPTRVEETRHVKKDKNATTPVVDKEDDQEKKTSERNDPRDKMVNVNNLTYTRFGDRNVHDSAHIKVSANTVYDVEFDISFTAFRSDTVDEDDLETAIKTGKLELRHDSSSRLKLDFVSMTKVKINGKGGTAHVAGKLTTPKSHPEWNLSRPLLALFIMKGSLLNSSHSVSLNMDEGKNDYGGTPVDPPVADKSAVTVHHLMKNEDATDEFIDRLKATGIDTEADEKNLGEPAAKKDYTHIQSSTKSTNKIGEAMAINHRADALKELDVAYVETKDVEDQLIDGDFTPTKEQHDVYIYYQLDEKEPTPQSVKLHVHHIVDGQIGKDPQLQDKIIEEEIDTDGHGNQFKAIPMGLFFGRVHIQSSTTKVSQAGEVEPIVDQGEALATVGLKYDHTTDAKGRPLSAQEVEMGEEDRHIYVHYVLGTNQDIPEHEAPAKVRIHHIASDLIAKGEAPGQSQALIDYLDELGKDPETPDIKHKSTWEYTGDGYTHIQSTVTKQSKLNAKETVESREQLLATYGLKVDMMKEAASYEDVPDDGLPVDSAEKEVYVVYSLATNNDPVNPIEPSEPIDPTPPVEPSDPDESTDPNEPTESNENTDNDSQADQSDNRQPSATTNAATTGKRQAHTASRATDNPSGDTENATGKWYDDLPQTGEKQSAVIVGLVGLIALLTGSLYWWKRRQ